MDQINPIPSRFFYGLDPEPNEEIGGDESDVGSDVDPQEEIRDDQERDTATDQSDTDSEDSSGSSTSDDDIPLAYRQSLLSQYVLDGELS